MKELLKEGIGGKNEFSTYHPLVILIYFVMVTGITMTVSSPGILIISFAAAWFYSVLLKGVKTIKFNGLMTIVIMLFTTLLNMFFTHDGDTVLFYINANRITMEAIVFGFFSGIVIVSIVIWFTCFNEIVTSEMIMYLFSRISSVMGLLISMIMRYIPLLKSRYEEISMGQKCLGNGNPQGLIAKIKLIVKKISILISWSLESSIESADSMAARGYGLKGRTSFHLYKASKRDFFLGGGFTVLLAGVIGFMSKEDILIQFYPELIFPDAYFELMLTGVFFAVLALLPAVIDIVGEFRWKKLELNN